MSRGTGRAPRTSSHGIGRGLRRTTGPAALVLPAVPRRAAQGRGLSRNTYVTPAVTLECGRTTMSVLLTCTDCGKEFETAWGHETETCDACSGRSRGPPERLPYLDP